SAIRIILVATSALPAPRHLLESGLLENSAASPLVLGGSVRRPARSPGVHDASPPRRAPYPTTSTLAACPRTRPSRASHVTGGASGASASARYAASDAVTFGRRSQMRPRNRWCG